MLRSSTARIRPRRYRIVCLRVECLDDRALPSTVSEAFYPVVMAGNPKGSPIDSPALRVDPNTTESPFAGVGSVLVTVGRTTHIGTGAAIGPRHILTAAHVIDLNADGKVDARDKTTGVYFVLNYGENQSHRIAVSQFDLHPDYTGFNRPAVNDDLAILTLAEDLPEGVPIYSLPTSDLLASTQLTLVGYGRSGDGVRGYTTLANPTIKRVGQNTVDGFYGQDDRDRPAANEVFRFDFDGPKGNGPLGGPTLGNNIETQLGSGDSGGPAFYVTPEGGYVLVGVNSFVQGNVPRYGSMGGGINIFSYLGFINSVLPYDPARDIVDIPAPIGGLPVSQPSTLPMPIPDAPIAPVVKPGVGIGAKRVSVEMPAFARASTTVSEFKYTWFVDEEEHEEPSISADLLSTETEDQKAVESFDTIDSWSIGGLVSIDLGLLALAADGSITVEE